MNREQPRAYGSNHLPNRIPVCNRKNVLDKCICGNRITDFRVRITGMPMYHAFLGTNQDIREISPPCSIKIPPDLAQVHAYIIRQLRQVAIREGRTGNRTSKRPSAFTLEGLWQKKTNCDTTRRRLNPSGRPVGPLTPKCMRRNRQTAASPSTTCWRCCPIPAASCTWGTCATTRLATRWRATVDARLQRAASDGLGRLRAAGGECRAQEQYASARVDPLAISPP